MSVSVPAPVFVIDRGPPVSEIALLTSSVPIVDETLKFPLAPSIRFNALVVPLRIVNVGVPNGGSMLIKFPLPSTLLRVRLLSVEVLLFSRIRELPFDEVMYWIVRSDPVSVIVVVPVLIKTSSLAVGTPLGLQLPAVVQDALVLKVFVAACAEWPSTSAATRVTVKELASSVDRWRMERFFIMVFNEEFLEMGLISGALCS